MEGQILIKEGDVWQPYNMDDIIIQFTSSSYKAIPGEIIYLYDATYPKPLSVYWMFGDGNDDELFSPTHSYNNEGTYSISLIVNYDVGSKTQTFKNIMNVDNSNIKPVPSPTQSLI